MVVSTSSTLSPEDVEKIRTAVEQDWPQANLARNWDSALALCYPDIVYMPPDQPALHGHRALREWLDRFPPIIEFVQLLEAIDGHADSATCRFSFSATVGVEGQRISGTGKGLAIVQRDSLGRWLAKAVCFNWDRPMSAS
jgi:ketosteroid isomerase-like protein